MAASRRMHELKSCCRNSRMIHHTSNICHLVLYPAYQPSSLSILCMSSSSADGAVIVDVLRAPVTAALAAGGGFFMGSCCNGIMAADGVRGGLSDESESELTCAAAGDWLAGT